MTDFEFNYYSTNGTDTKFPVQGTEKDGVCPSPLKEVPKTIFEGITRNQAEEYGLEDEFRAANTDGDDSISKEELKAYEDKKNGIVRSSSGKRVAKGGLYRIQSGDTINKIAADFGLDPKTLYLVNIKSIVKHNGMIIAGHDLIVDTTRIPEELTDEEIAFLNKKGIEQRERIKQNDNAQFSKCLENLEIPEVMINKLSEVLGEDISKLSAEEIFKKASGLSVDTLQNMIKELKNSEQSKDVEEFLTKFKQNVQMSGANKDISKMFESDFDIICAAFEDSTGAIFDKMTELMGADAKKMSLAELTEKIRGLDRGSRTLLKQTKTCVAGDIEISLGYDLSSPDQKQKFFKYLGITEEEYQSIPIYNRRAYIKDKYNERKAADLNEDNPDSLFIKFLDELKRGNFTVKERDLMKQLEIDPASLTFEDLVNMAHDRVDMAYAQATSCAGIEAILRDEDTDFYDASVEAQAEDRTVRNKSHVARVYFASSEAILNDGSLSHNVKEHVANINVEYFKDLGMDQLDDDNYTLASISLLKYADTAHIEQYIKDNADKIDIIENVINSLANNTQDTSRQEVYRNAQVTVAEVKKEIEETGSYSGGKTSGGRSPAAGNGSTGATYNNAQAEYVASLKAANQAEYQVSQNNSSSVTNPIKGTEKTDNLSRFNSSYFHAQADNKSGHSSFKIDEMLDDIKNYNSLKPEKKDELDARVRALDISQLILVFTSGDNDVKKFILQYIPMNILLTSVTADDARKFSDDIMEKLGSHIQKDIMAGTKMVLSPVEMVIIKHCKQNGILI